jgi:hypothetical protein
MHAATHACVWKRVNAEYTNARCLLQTVFPYGAQVKAIVAAISALRGSVGGGKEMSLFTSDNAYVLAPADATTAVAWSRTVQQVRTEVASCCLYPLLLPELNH